MMTLAEMAEHAVKRTGVDDDTTQSLAKDFLKRRYVSTYNKYPWKEAHSTFQFRSTENGVILPDWVDKVVQVRVDNAEDARNLQMVSRQTVMMAVPGALDDDGARVAYTLLSPVATHSHPNGEKLTVVSSDASDTTQTIRIRGTHNGLRIEESLMLVGATPVTTQYYYDEIQTLSKPETAGDLTIDTATSGDQVQVLLAAERERKHQRIQFLYDFESGADEEVFTVLVKQKVTPLRHDSDTPQLANIEDALIAFAIADLWERQRQFAKAQLKVSEAVALVNEAVLAERDQQQNHVQIIPEIYDYAEQRTLY